MLESEFLTSVREALPREAVVFSDMAVCGYWVSAYHDAHDVRRLHYPMGWGTLGFAFPASIGAAAAGAAPVVVFAGDGGILFGISELAVAAQEKLPITIVVVDDGGYGMLRYGTDIPETATELYSLDFTAIAEGFGVKCHAVDGVGVEFRRALQGAVQLREPVVIHVKARLAPPPTTGALWPLART